MDDKCLIWGTPAKVGSDGRGDYLVVDSPRAGGRYRVTSSVSSSAIKKVDPTRLTEWLVSERRNGELAPLITSHALDLANSLPGVGVLERRDRALESLAGRSTGFGSKIAVSGTVTTETKNNLDNLAVATQSRNEQEAASFIGFLQEGGLVERNSSQVWLTFKGWEYLENRRAQEVASVQAFVAMWFSKATEAAYADGIAPAIRESGYASLRIDQKEHVNKVDDEIIAEIRRSKFIVADFTSEPEKPRGGVYFEAGFAMGLEKGVIWTCHTDSLKFVHFDTRQFNHIVWTDPADLKTKLKNRIGAVFGQGPLN